MRDLLIDARCLQDSAFAGRGIGVHSAALIAGGRTRADIRACFRFIALCDPALPPLAEHYHRLFDGSRGVAYQGYGADTAFLQLSPMTHDPLWVARLLADRRVPSVALVYDFIPHDYPQHYLCDAPTRVRYHACLASLRLYDELLAISDAARAQLIRIVAPRADLIAVTGVALRPALLPNGALPRVSSDLRRILVPGGEDWRKNPEIVVRAHASSAALQHNLTTIELIGLTRADTQSRLRDIARDAGGNPDLLVFHPFLDDASLACLYRASDLVVVPSRSEGFSIPVIEAMAQAIPVLVSDCPAHAELVRDRQCRFDPDDPDDLQQKLDDLAAHPHQLAAITASGATIWPQFTDEQVNRRAWDAIVTLIDGSRTLASPAIARKQRPRIAFISPMPPTASGCAEFSAQTLHKLASLADVSLFTNTPSPALIPGVRYAGRPGRFAHVSGTFDAVIDVVGNAQFHHAEFNLLCQHGAACVAHDARMVDFYVHCLGIARACAQASAEAGRPVAPTEIEHWLANPGELPVLFLGEIAAASRPLFVHSVGTAKLIERLYDHRPIVLPFPPYRHFTDAELSEPARARVRARLGIDQDTLIIASFGTISADRAPGELIWATELLGHWGVRARLVFIGQTNPAVSTMIDQIAEEAGIPVTIIADRDNQALYRDWLIACDMAVQLRAYGFGALSGALIDCIAAAVPSIANADLAKALNAPDYVTTIPDALSAPLLAEAMIDILERAAHRPRPIAARNRDFAQRNFTRYCCDLLNGLGFG